VTHRGLALPAVAAPPLRALTLLWRFSRPHTLVGTTVSILGIAAITGTGGVGDLLATLVAGWTVNIFIVGINQIEDVEIDRVNKPGLPIAAGDLSLEAARAIVAVCAVVPVVLAITQGVVETVAVLVALAVGAAYSCPPLRLKRFPAVAAGCISLVRALVVNLGVCLHFTGTVPPSVWALTLFVLPFSFAIAVLKDVPDAEGDRRFSIATFTVRLGGDRVKRIGMAALIAGYLGMIAAAQLGEPFLWAGGHLAALALLCWWARGADPADRDGFTRFYMRVWMLFFAEYVLVPVAVLTG
jgi:homogentisate phytyltransferase/homogentisate geranylgeranyltransferase